MRDGWRGGCRWCGGGGDAQHSSVWMQVQQGSPSGPASLLGLPLEGLSSRHPGQFRASRSSASQGLATSRELSLQGRDAKQAWTTHLVCLQVLHLQVRDEKRHASIQFIFAPRSKQQATAVSGMDMGLELGMALSAPKPTRSRRGAERCHDQ